MSDIDKYQKIKYAQFKKVKLNYKYDKDVACDVVDFVESAYFPSEWLDDEAEGILNEVSKSIESESY